jgi:hypothetical protein
MATQTYSSIAYTVLGSPAASITFSSISSAYSDLRLVLSGMATGTVNLYLQINGDTAGNYSYRYVGGSGAAASSASSQGVTQILVIGEIASMSTTIPSMATLDFLQYKNTGMYKDVLITSANDNNGSGETTASIGLWRSTSAITSVVISTNSSTLATGFTAELIGIL